MKSHVLRPLWVVLALVAVVLLFRVFYVPQNFGIGKRGYMYGWHREANVEDWKNFKVKYNGSSEFCNNCHPDKYESVMKTPHAIIICEDCHGPAIDHPVDPPKLTIDKSRGLCLRCHTYLAYPTSGRADIRGIDPAEHNPDMECVMCHNPHNPMEGLR